MENKKIKIAVIGLGYVGLPLAVIFSKKYNVVGFDSNKSRVKELNILNDRTNEVDKIKLQEALNNNLEITDNHNIISNCNVYIITVPTPIDKDKNPDLSYLLNATKENGKVLTKGILGRFENVISKLTDVRTSKSFFTKIYPFNVFTFAKLYGGCQLYDLSISQIINHVTCYKLKCSHWLKYSLQSECCNFSQ